MAQDRPTASELLNAIADFLRDEATPALDKSDPRLGFQMRVSASGVFNDVLKAGSAPTPTRASWRD